MNDTSKKVEWTQVNDYRWVASINPDLMLKVDEYRGFHAYAGQEIVVGPDGGTFPDLPSAQAAAIARARSIARQILHDTGGDEVLEALKAVVAALQESSSDRGLIAQHGDALDQGLAAISSAEAGIKR